MSFFNAPYLCCRLLVPGQPTPAFTLQLLLKGGHGAFVTDLLSPWAQP